MIFCTGVHPVPKEHNSWLHSVLTHILHSHLDAIPWMITVTIVKVNMKWKENPRTAHWYPLSCVKCRRVFITLSALILGACIVPKTIMNGHADFTQIPKLVCTGTHTLRNYRQWHCQFVRITYRYWVLIRLHKYHWYIYIHQTGAKRIEDSDSGPPKVESHLYMSIQASTSIFWVYIIV